MRKLVSVLIALIACVSSCEMYDHSEILDKLNDHEDRIVALEKLCTQINSNITSLQTIVTALGDNDYIVDVETIMEGGVELGYKISFAKSEAIVVYHGVDGKDGSDGEDGLDGQDAQIPLVGIKKDTDGKYYWTLDGEWLLDQDGYKIRASGQNGESGITPMLKIENGNWLISRDNGQSWDILGPSIDTSLQSYRFIDTLTEDEDTVQLKLSDGTVIEIPKEKPFGLIFEKLDDFACLPGTQVLIPFRINGDTDGLKIDCMNDSMWDCSVELTSQNEGFVKAIAQTEADVCKIIVLATNGRSFDMVTLTIDKGIFTYEDNSYPIPASGGIIEFPYEANLGLVTKVPEDAKEWLCVIQTRATPEKCMMRFEAKANEGENVRYADVIIANEAGDKVGEIRFYQYGGLFTLETSHESILFNTSRFSKSMNVKASQEWNIMSEDIPNWLKVSPLSSDLSDGQDTILEVQVEQNQGEDRCYELVLKCGDNQKTIPVYQEGNIGTYSIYFNDFDKNIVSENQNMESSYDWRNETGLGASSISYSGKNITARKTLTSEAVSYEMSCYKNDSHYYYLSGYRGSGGNNMFFGNNAHFIVKDIPTMNAKDFFLTFGVAEQDKSKFHLYISEDSNKWVELEYLTKYIEFSDSWHETWNEPCDCVKPRKRWGIAEVGFSVGSTVGSIDLCFVSDTSSTHRIDDLRLSLSNEEECLIDFSTGVELDFTKIPESPGQNLNKVTIAEFLQKEADTQVWYELTGKIISIASSVYGNITIEDETGRVYIHGLTTQFATTNDKSFASLGLEIGDIVTLATTNYVYNGSVQGGGSVPAFYISHEKGGSADTRTFKKVTSITSGKRYLIYSNGKIAGFIGSDYGYLPGVEVEVADDVIAAEEINSYEITETAEGYTIKQSDGRFMYLKNTYNSMNFSAQPSSGYFWTISKEDDDSFLIQNVLKGKTLQYDTSYGNFACYSSYNGTKIFLYEMSE